MLIRLNLKSFSPHNIHPISCWANLQLFNRKHLLQQLNLAEKTPDNELIIEGYKQLGTHFFNELDGNFAFVLIDALQKKAYAVRDIFGAKPLYFSQIADEIFIADAIPLLIKHIPTEPNEKFIKEYFSDSFPNSAYSSLTPYKNIFRVLPAHYLELEAGKTSQKLYWKLNIEQYEGINDGSLIEIVRQKLINAVRKRMANEPMATTLSGGLDSSLVGSIAKMASENTIQSIYFNTNFQSSDERYYANQVAEKWHITLHEMQFNAKQLPLAQKFIETWAMPDCLAMPAAQFFLIGHQLEKLGTKIFLTGEGGDSVMAYGYNYFEELYQQQNWQLLQESIEAYTQKRDLSHYFENWHQLDYSKKAKLYANQFHENIIIRYLKEKQFSKALNTYKIASKHFKISNISLFSRIAKSIWSRVTKKPFNLLNKSFSLKKFSEKYDYFDISQFSNKLTEHQKEHLKYCFTTINISAAEEQTEVLRSLGIETFHPFFDKELLEISLAITEKIKFDKGNLRGTLRQATKDILPEEVRLRTTKAAFNEFTLHTFQQLWEEAESSFPATHKLWKYVDYQQFMKLIAKVKNPQISVSDKSKYIWLGNRTVYLGLWLDYYENLAGNKAQ